MTDLSMTIAPESDQLNADDLISGPRIIRITKVSANPDLSERPVSVYFDGDDGKPFKPCKSMRRVLVHVWGKDGNAYPGRAMTLYRDPKVKFGGLEVGGIRISHMSHIEKDVTLALTVTRAARKPYIIKPLPSASIVATKAAKSDRTVDVVRGLIERIEDADSPFALADLSTDDTVRKQRDWLRQNRPDLSERVETAFAEAEQVFGTSEDAEAAE